MKVPFGRARSSVLDEELPGSLEETRRVLLEHDFVSLVIPICVLHSCKWKVFELLELVIIDMHLFFDILARNGAVAEAGLAQDTPAAFPQTRELASSQRQCNIDSALPLQHLL